MKEKKHHCKQNILSDVPQTSLDEEFLIANGKHNILPTS